MSHALRKTLARASRIAATQPWSKVLSGTRASRKSLGFAGYSGDAVTRAAVEATAAVRDRLLKIAPPEMRDKILAIVQTIVGEVKVASRSTIPTPRSGTRPQPSRQPERLHRQSLCARLRLQERDCRHSLLAATPIDAIEPVINNPRPDGLIVACKASRLGWTTTTMIIRNRANCSSGLAG